MASKTIKVCDHCEASGAPIETFYLTHTGKLLDDASILLYSAPENCRRIDLCDDCICRFLKEGMKKLKFI